MASRRTRIAALVTLWVVQMGLLGASLGFIMAVVWIFTSTIPNVLAGAPPPSIPWTPLLIAAVCHVGANGLEDLQARWFGHE